MGVSQIQEALAECNALIEDAQRQADKAVNEATRRLNEVLQAQLASTDASEQATTSEPSGETVTMDKSRYDALAAQLDKVAKVVKSNPELFRDIKL